jgi:hypothetical protein
MTAREVRHHPTTSSDAAPAGSVRERCQRLIAGLDIPVPFNVDDLCARVAARRGRPLRLVPVETTGEDQLSGFWAGYAEDDVIVFESGTTPYHRACIVLHELGHILFDHHPASDLATDVAAAVPDASGAALRMLGRHAYPDVEEQEAETFATLMLERYPASGPGVTDATAARTVEQLQSTFQG